MTGPAYSVARVSMRGHGRGGSLLVVPSEMGPWRESVVHPILYALVPPFSVLADLMENRNGDPKWNDALRRVIDGVAGLTAVDGATVITQPYQVLAFGVKIVRRRGPPQVTQVIVTKPVEGARPRYAESLRELERLLQNEAGPLSNPGWRGGI